jgi:hypothetical protein
VAIGVLTGTGPCSRRWCAGGAGRDRAVARPGRPNGPTADVLGGDLLRRDRRLSVLIGLSDGGSAAKLNSYLFGAITTTSAADLLGFAVLDGGGALRLGRAGARGSSRSATTEEYAAPAG